MADFLWVWCCTHLWEFLEFYLPIGALPSNRGEDLQAKCLLELYGLKRFCEFQAPPKYNLGVLLDTFTRTKQLVQELHRQGTIVYEELKKLEFSMQAPSNYISWGPFEHFATPGINTIGICSTLSLRHETTIFMTTPMDKSWMSLTNRLRSPAYADGVNTFLTFARNHSMGSDRIRCPCHSCCNNLFLPIFQVETHLFINGINPNYTQWIFHGKEETRSFNDNDDDIVADYFDEYIDNMDHMLDDIRVGTFVEGPQDHCNPSSTPGSIPDPSPSSSFNQLLEDARRPLFTSCTKFSKLSFIVKLLHIKTLGGWSIKSFDMLLNLLRSSFPDAELPHSYEESRSLERGLDFNYHKIHACPNDCILFWKENADLNECPICKASRWVSNTHKTHLIPQKVLRHFPLKSRLQRLFVSAKIVSDMRWHKEQRPTDDASLRHPADSESWKRFDEEHSWFAQDARNVRLGMASDGFNPFNNMAKPYSIWPVILVPYNLPPWLCMKDQFYMTSLIIPGPKSPGKGRSHEYVFTTCTCKSL